MVFEDLAMALVRVELLDEDFMRRVIFVDECFAELDVFVLLFFELIIFSGAFVGL